MVFLDFGWLSDDFSSDFDDESKTEHPETKKTNTIMATLFKKNLILNFIFPPKSLWLQFSIRIISSKTICLKCQLRGQGKIGQIVSYGWSIEDCIF